MGGDFIVKVFDRQDDASVTLSALKAMHAKPILGLDTVVRVTRDSDGSSTISGDQQIPSHPSSRLSYILAEALINDDSETDIQVLADAGMDEYFLTLLKAALRPGRSALVIYVPDSAIADVSQLVNILGLFRGQLYQTTCPEVVEQRILAHV